MTKKRRPRDSRNSVWKRSGGSINQNHLAPFRFFGGLVSHGVDFYEKTENASNFQTFNLENFFFHVFCYCAILIISLYYFSVIPIFWSFDFVMGRHPKIIANMTEHLRVERISCLDIYVSWLLIVFKINWQYHDGVITSFWQLLNSLRWNTKVNKERGIIFAISNNNIQFCWISYHSVFYLSLMSRMRKIWPDQHTVRNMTSFFDVSTRHIFIYPHKKESTCNVLLMDLYTQRIDRYDTVSGAIPLSPLVPGRKKSERWEEKNWNLIFTFVTAWIPPRDFENLAGVRYGSVSFIRIALRSCSN